MALEIIILAAGMGKRMQSDLPKVLHPIGGKPMLQHLIDNTRQVNAARIHIVIGTGGEQVRSALAADDINWVIQSEQLGTGHAALQALPACDPANDVLILLGDAPLVQSGKMRSLLDLGADLALLTVRVPDPTGYGRITRADNGTVRSIVEQGDVTEQENLIDEINTGVMAARASDFLRWLDDVTPDNAQREYQLTDVVRIAAAGGESVQSFVAADPAEVAGVNDRVKLAESERVFQRWVARDLMLAGASLADPARIDVRGKLTVGRDVEIDVNCVFEGEVHLASGVRVMANCCISDSSIGEGSVVKPNSVVDGAVVESGCSVGPFARLRPGAHLEDQVAIGNFVEVKKSHVGRGTKASHLAYLGDATIGRDVNIGAGTITCNYDGVNKHPTTIGDDVFVGTNTSLVAPVTISDGSTIAAGSTITRNVAENALALGRARQVQKSNWPRPVKKS